MFRNGVSLCHGVRNFLSKGVVSRSQEELAVSNCCVVKVVAQLRHKTITRVSCNHATSRECIHGKDNGKTCVIRQ